MTSGHRDLKLIYDELDYIHNQAIKNLDKLFFDHKLLEAGWELYLACDFDIIRRFAFEPAKIFERFFTNHPLDEELFIFSKRQSATAYLLFQQKQIEQPFLMPRHIIEFEKTKLWLSMKQFQKRIKVATLRNWGLKFLSNEERTLLLEISKYPQISKKSIPNDLFESLLSLIKTKFFEFLLVISGYYNDELKILLNLIEASPPKLQLNAPVIQNNVSIIESFDDEITTNWINVFKKIRTNRKYRDSNVSDGKVLSIITELNKYFIANNKKKLILFVSDAESMSTIFQLSENKKYRYLSKKYKIDNKLVIPELPWEMDILRDPDVFLLFLMCASRSDDLFESIGNMKAQMYSIEWSMQFLKDFIAKCDNCDTCPEDRRKSCVNVLKLIESHIKTHNELISLNFIAARFPLLKPYSSFDQYNKDETELDKAIKIIFQFLIGESKELDEYIRKGEDELENLLNASTMKLTESSFNVADKSISSFCYDFHPLTKLPFKVEFKNKLLRKKLNEIYKYIIEYRDNINAKDIRNYLLELFELTRSKDVGIENHLLLALLNYGRNLELVNIITTDYLLYPDEKIRLEFILLHLLASHQIAIINKDERQYRYSYHNCQVFLGTFKNEARLHFLEGKIILRGIEAKLDKYYSYDHVINKFKISKKIVKKVKRDHLFLVSLNNSMAYAIMRKKKHTKAEIIDVTKAISEMEELLQEEEWDADFVDTKGYYHLFLANCTDETDQKIKNLNHAIEYFKKANDIAYDHYYFTYQKKIIKDHMENAKKQLKNIKYKKNVRK